MSAVSAGPAPKSIERRFDSLLILDIDEVVLHFITPFQALLAEHGAQLHAESFRLTGNVRSIATGTALSGHVLDRVTAQLYEEQEKRQTPVEGVGESLGRLSAVADIVFLTAMTPAYYDHRRRLLDRSGLSYPMIATERSKGGVVAELSEGRAGPVVFVDDLPPNLHGVRKSAGHVELVHLMANDIFRAHLPPLPTGAHSATDWVDGERLLTRLLGAESL